MVDTARLEIKLVPDTKELEKTLKKYQGEQVQVEATMPGASGGKDRGGALAGVMGSFAKIGAVVGVLYGIKEGIDLVNEQINDMDMRMREINPALKGQADMLKKIQDLSLLPMSMVLTQFLKPYLLKMTMLSKQSMLAAQPILERYAAGEITLDEAMEELSPVFEKTTKEMSEINKDMETQKKKIQGNLEGTKDSIEFMDKMAIEAAGVFEYIGSFLKGPALKEIEETPIGSAAISTGLAAISPIGFAGYGLSKIGDFLGGILGFGGKEDDFLVSNGKVHSINPEDTIVGYKGRSNPVSNTNNNVTVNLHVDGFLDDTTITTIANEVRRATERGIG